MRTRFLPYAAAAALAAIAIPTVTVARFPAPSSAPGETLVATMQAQGAQIYECKLDNDGKLVWQFREPVATLLLNGETVGRHYAGPSWEMRDGSAVFGRVAARAPGATPDDIPLLLLDAVESRGTGLLAGVTIIERLNTVGGVASGSCTAAGAFRSVPYSAVYNFLKKAD